MSFIHHDVRFIAKGFYNFPATPAMTINFGNSATWEAARRRPGAIANLQRLRAGTSKSGKGGARGGDGNGIQQAAITLASTPTFPAAWNQKDGWTGANSEFVTQIDNFPDRYSPSLQYEKIDDPSSFLSPAIAQIGKNGAICLRFYLYEASKDADGRAVWAATWANWRFEVADGQVKLLRKSEEWTGSLETQLLDLLDLEEPSGEQQTQIDALRAQIYADSHSVELGKGETYETWHTVTLLPEPRGFVNVLLPGVAESQSFEQNDIIKTREEGVLWPACRVTVEARGGMYDWQLGRPQFATSGVLRCGAFWPPSVFTLELPITFAGQSSTPDNTSIVFSVEIVGAQREIVATFTGDGLSTPMLYTAEAFIEAGARAVDNTVALDSNDPALADAHGQSPVENIEINFEGEMRQASATLTIRNPHGGLPSLGPHFAGLHDRLCNLEIDGAPFLADALIKTATWNTVRDATPNQPTTFLAGAETRLTFEIASIWAILDEDLMQDSPVLDGMKLGAALRTVLRGTGTPWTAMAGIDENAGRTLPKAAPGEAPEVRPNLEISRGDYLRSLVETYGRGWRLYYSPTGVWTFAPPDKTVKATFSSSPGAGRFQMFDPIDLVRDYADFYNSVAVQGADDADGLPITRSWTWQDSYLSINSRRYIGRIKRLATVRDEACRTPDDAASAARSLAQYRGQSGRFLGFDAFFHLLYPGDRIIADDALYIIRRIPRAAPFDDEMNIVGQEIIE